MEKIENLNIAANYLLPTPQEVKSEIPLSEKAAQAVMAGRNAIERILRGEDRRIILVVGPCAIHDLKAAHEYAGKLASIVPQVKDSFEIVMRVYFEKPRTTTGWKGLINDPNLDDSFHIEKGLRIARKLMLDLAELGLPIATEALDPVVPQYLADLVSWTAIGARTAESQTHRELASGLSSPVGFKNGTDGNIQIAINAIHTAAMPHRFLGINQFGQSSVFETRGNRYGHIVLRGGKKPNYFAADINDCETKMKAQGVPPLIMVDCSHGNSLKDPDAQPGVFYDVIGQIERGNRSVIGLMLESNLFGGRQELTESPESLRYGVSITDGCLGWERTAALIVEGAARLRKPVHS